MALRACRRPRIGRKTCGTGVKLGGLRPPDPPKSRTPASGGREDQYTGLGQDQYTGLGQDLYWGLSKYPLLWARQPPVQILTHPRVLILTQTRVLILMPPGGRRPTFGGVWGAEPPQPGS